MFEVVVQLGPTHLAKPNFGEHHGGAVGWGAGFAAYVARQPAVPGCRSHRASVRSRIGSEGLEGWQGAAVSVCGGEGEGEEGLC